MPERHRHAHGGMSSIVRLVTRWLFPLMLVFGLAVALFGHLSPGGGFAGGVIFACAFLLSTLAFGAERGPAGSLQRVAPLIESGTALAFLGLVSFGHLAGSFLVRWDLRGEAFTLGSAPGLVLLNLLILLKVGAGLFAGFAVIAAFGHGPGGREDAS